MQADEIPQAVQWCEGMLLAAQHFQQSSSRSEMLVQYASLLVAPYCWGIRRIAFDKKLLPAGTVRVVDLEAVMPDGSIVAHRPEQDRELMTSIAPDAFPRGAGILIHLAIPAREAGGRRGVLERYQAEESDPVPDFNTGEGDIRMPLLRPKLALMAGDTPPPKFVSMPIGEVRFEDEACVLTPYIPPTMTVPSHSALAELCGELAARVREKAMFISEQVRSPSSVVDKPLMQENSSRMQSLVAGLPAFEALLSSGAAHPFPLYVTLCGMAGSLAALGSGMMPPVFSPYNHRNLRASFEEVIVFALRMASEGIPETYNAYPFRNKDRVFSLMFDPEWAGRNLVLGMRTGASVTEKEMIAWGDECLIGSEAILALLRDRRIRGAQRQFVEQYEDLVPVRGVVLFTLKADPEFVRPGELLHIMNLGERGRAFSPLEIVLYVKRSA